MRRKQRYPDLWNFRLTSLVAATVLLVLLGEGMRRINHWEKQGYRVKNKSTDRIWLWTALLVSKNVNDKAKILQVKPEVDPWRINPNELNRNRVVYNLSTKRGFVELGVLIFSSIVMLYAGAMAVTYAWQWQWRKLQLFSQTQVRIEIAGTVRIEAKQGVIYLSHRTGRVSNLKRTSNSQEYALSVLPIVIRVEQTI